MGTLFTWAWDSIVINAFLFIGSTVLSIINARNLL